MCNAAANPTWWDRERLIKLIAAVGKQLDSGGGVDFWAGISIEGRNRYECREKWRAMSERTGPSDAAVFCGLHAEFKAMAARLTKGKLATVVRVAS